MRLRPSFVRLLTCRFKTHSPLKSGQSQSAAEEYFNDGLTEAIIHALSAVEGLRVVARTSAFAFKPKNSDVREISRILNVGLVLEGQRSQIRRKAAGTTSNA
jgi:TolB-like protein